MNNNLHQPITINFVPSSRKKTALSLSQFLELLKNEENYFKGEQNDTKRMITRLRKIFYDAYGWNRELIRGAAKIAGRYEVKLVPAAETGHYIRKVLVKKGDWMNPNAGTEPEIYKDDNQEVVLPSELFCDMGHVLAGMDCYNHPEPVAPLPNALMFLKKLVPHGDRNIDVATWLGDLASISGEILYAELIEKKHLNTEEIQHLINACAPGQDMLGNIDSYIISQSYNIGTNKGMRVSDIFHEFYNTDNYNRLNRFILFCQSVGLKNWDGNNFENEKRWLKYYRKQLRNTIVFYIGTRFPRPVMYFVALACYLRIFDKKMKMDLFLENFLLALKNKIKENETVDNRNIESIP